MPVFQDVRGQPTYGLGLCARCSRRFPLAKLRPDGNAPGLMVCADDWDSIDPYRLPARGPDRLNLPFVRPDIPLAGLPSVHEEEDIPDPWPGSLPRP